MYVRSVVDEVSSVPWDIHNQRMARIEKARKAKNRGNQMDSNCTGSEKRMTKTENLWVQKNCQKSWCQSVEVYQIEQHFYGRIVPP